MLIAILRTLTRRNVITEKLTISATDPNASKTAPGKKKTKTTPQKMLMIAETKTSRKAVVKLDRFVAIVKVVLKCRMKDQWFAVLRRTVSCRRTSVEKDRQLRKDQWLTVL